MLRVLVADDSALAREALTRLIDDDPEMVVAGVASGGAEAIEKAATLKPDLITLDLLMPDMDGVETTARIMATSPTPIVLVSSTVTAAFASTHFDALAVGAVDVVGKPDFQRMAGDAALRRRFLQNLKAMGTVVTVARRPPPQRAPSPSAARTSDLPGLPPRVALIVVGASTGGPSAIAATLSKLTPETSPPVLVVQHMASGFIEGFAEWLRSKTAARVEVASNGVRANAGTIYVAPDDHHLELTAYGRLVVQQAPPVRHQRPSVDVLFESAAAQLGPRSLGILLTGMGDDGARGLLSMRRSGAFTIAQDKESSVVYGMPGAAAERGAASWITSCDKLAQALAGLRCDAREPSGRPS